MFGLKIFNLTKSKSKLYYYLAKNKKLNSVPDVKLISIDFPAILPEINGTIFLSLSKAYKEVTILVGV